MYLMCRKASLNEFMFTSAFLSSIVVIDLEDQLLVVVCQFLFQLGVGRWGRCGNTTTLSVSVKIFLFKKKLFIILGLRASRYRLILVCVRVLPPA